HARHGGVCHRICGRSHVSDSGWTSQVQTVQCPLLKVTGLGLSRPSESAIDRDRVPTAHARHHHRCAFSRVLTWVISELESRANRSFGDMGVLLRSAYGETHGGLESQTCGIPHDYRICRCDFNLDRCRSQESWSGVVICILSSLD